MQMVEQISEETVKLGPGTLNGAFANLEKEKLIEKGSEEERRKTFELTSKGQAVLKEQILRLEIMTRSGQKMTSKIVVRNTK